MHSRHTHTREITTWDNFKGARKPKPSRRQRRKCKLTFHSSANCARFGCYIIVYPLVIHERNLTTMTKSMFYSHSLLSLKFNGKNSSMHFAAVWLLWAPTLLIVYLTKMPLQFTNRRHDPPWLTPARSFKLLYRLHSPNVNTIVMQLQRLEHTSWYE